MPNAGQWAALVAAVFWAAAVCAGIYVLAKLARLLSEAARLVADLRARSDLVFERAQAAVDRANEQLDKTGEVAAGMDELNTGMSELASQVSALAGLGRAVAAGPAGKAAAFVYGVRRAVALRRGVRPGAGRRTVRAGHAGYAGELTGPQTAPRETAPGGAARQREARQVAPR
ncbi:MAG TPA: hypothetical protein VKV80_01500 [Streptosporangiaceae bacterium]|nr:hypothetical protein [Streptosporangiaceae bacterium]